jgi:hypothetical protein
MCVGLHSQIGGVVPLLRKVTGAVQLFSSTARRPRLLRDRLTMEPQAEMAPLCVAPCRCNVRSTILLS